MVDVILTAAAELEYSRALEWYDLRGAGGGFERDVDHALTFLADFPEAGTACDDLHRYFALRRYPYGVVYRLRSGLVTVVALPHHRRLPGYWLGAR